MDRLPCIAEIPTLLDAGGELDLPAMQAIRERLHSAGYQDACVAGLIGEYSGLSLEALEKLLRGMLDGAKDMRMICGALDAGTEKTAERIRAVAALGCDSHLVLPAYFFGMSNPEEILRHTRRLSKEGGQLILADSPAHVGYTIPDQILPALMQVSELEALLSDHCFAEGRVYTGDRALLMNMSGGGVVSRLAFLFPGLIMRLSRGESVPKNVRIAMLELLEAHAHRAAALKYAAFKLGLCESEAVFAPAMPLDDATRSKIADMVCVIAREEASYG